jgi:putative phosphoribosyl transferase
VATVKSSLDALHSNDRPPLPPQLEAAHPALLDSPHISYCEVRIDCSDATLQGDLAMPPEPIGLVLFAHGSGSGRHSARNRQVAQNLQRAGMATLLFDLLTAVEEQNDVHSGEHRFNMALLARRMQDATEWAAQQPQLQGLPVGYFGASTGSAAALIAAARLGARITAVVSRGGRPDLAGPVALAAVTAPTLLIVGGADHGVLELNEEASRHLQPGHRLSIVPEATHLFEEPGALEQVAKQAAAWFTQHFNSALKGRAPHKVAPP